MDELREFYAAVDATEVPASLKSFRPETAIIQSVIPGLSGLGLGLLTACVLYGLSCNLPNPVPTTSVSVAPYLAHWAPEETK